jgi:putative ABC transport system permease protein
VLGRQVSRRRDAAVRAALGASRARLVREAAVENGAVALLGAAAGLGAAAIALPALVRLLPPDMPRLTETAVGPTVVAVVALMTLLTVSTFGILPTFLSTRGVLQPLLRQGAQTESRDGRRTLDVLVVGQLALALILGVGAALLLRSLWALSEVQPGFSPERVLTMRLQPAGGRYRAPGRTLAYYREVADRVRALPGVEAVGLVNHLPLSGYNWTSGFEPLDRPSPAGAPAPSIGWRMVDGEYFAAMQIPLRTGRLFGTADDGNAPPVVIVNEAAARRFFAAPEQALGKSVRLTGATGEQQVTIVGVVGDVRHTSLAMAPQPEMYRPMAQAFGMAMTLVARTTGAPASASAAVRTAVWSVDPNVAIAGMGPLTAVVRDNLARPRMMAVLLAVFAAVGLAIVLCGVYGVVAYTVRRREREMGIRLALGAGPWAVAALVLRQGLSYAVAASLLGLPLALAGARVLRGLLFGVQPHDPATLAFICVAVVSTTLAATLLPARRAGRVEPAAVLKGN